MSADKDIRAHLVDEYGVPVTDLIMEFGVQGDDHACHMIATAFTRGQVCAMKLAAQNGSGRGYEH